MRPFVRVALTALGLTEIYTLLLLAPLLHPRHMALYHWTATAGSFFLPTFFDIGILWLLFTLLLHATQRPGKLRTTLWGVLFVLTPPVAVTEWNLLWRDPSSLSPRLLLALAGAVCLLALLLKLPSFHALWLRAIDFAATVLLFVGLGGALLLAQLTWFARQARGIDHPSPLHSPVPPSPRPRILWIVFDELSYQQIYERRFPGLQLPAFDALAAQSTVFTQVVPAGNFTDNVLPTLLSGSLIDAVRASPSGELSVHHTDSAQWGRFDPHQSVFQDALDAGYGTAIVGWYLPYCRLLPAVLDRCVSSYEIGAKSGLSPGATLAQNMARPMVLVAGAMLPAFASSNAAGDHIADYERLTGAANQLLADPSATFILLHLPVPHLGGIYNRRTGQLTTAPANYLDNLTLADRCLGQLRAQLERSGQWDATTVLVMGDHGWRTTPTGRTPWTTEEEIASHGGIFDPRPAYLVKMPHQHSEAVLSRPFPAISTRDLIDAILKGEVQSPKELASWVDGHP